MTEPLDTETRTPACPGVLSPRLIASGVGLSSREELVGLCALIEATNVIEVAADTGARLARHVGLEMQGMQTRVAEAATSLLLSGQTDDMLRHRLWSQLTKALDAGNATPRSVRHLHEQAAALGVMSSKALSPGLRAMERAKKRSAERRTTPLNRLEDGVREILADPASLLRSEPPRPFPEIVAGELASMLDGLALSDAGKTFEPEIAAALHQSGQQAWTGIAAAGGWVGLAAAVNGAGFAPYILAAQVSAFLPFVSGPALVSFLAVMVNPVTITAGLLVLGGFGGHRITTTIRAQVAARICVLLALRGLADPDTGSSRLSDAFRTLFLPNQIKPEHVEASEWQELCARTRHLQEMLDDKLPAAPGAAPTGWDMPVRGVSESFLAADVAATAGLTAAEMLYHAAAIDPRVIAAADFSRRADIGDPLDFATHAMGFAVNGADIALRGFTAEQVVMNNLIAGGHHVSLPESCNNQGFDLIVDGEAIQVKCGESLSILREHFASYPDIPVIANAQLLEQAADQSWAELVTTLDGFDLASVEELANRTVAAGLDLASTNAIMEAIAVGALRGAWEMARGEIPAEQLPAWLVVDTALRGSLAFAGARRELSSGLSQSGLRARSCLALHWGPLQSLDWMAPRPASIASSTVTGMKACAQQGQTCTLRFRLHCGGASICSSRMRKELQRQTRPTPIQ